MDPFKPMSGRFKDRVGWDGNPERYDVSIHLWKLQFDDNGTYTCQVKNPPDVDGLVGEIRLSVVQTGRSCGQVVWAGGGPWERRGGGTLL